MSLLDSVVVVARNVTHPDRLITFRKGDVCSEVEWTSGHSVIKIYPFDVE